MALYDELFPSKRSLHYVQTEWSSDWSDFAGGFAYAAEHITEHQEDFGTSIDQTGLAVFFLQRHRVELMLKALLDAAGMETEKIVALGHSLTRLWTACGARLGPSREWAEFEADFAELVAALAKVDQLSFAFRYPMGKKGEEIKRPKFIDLQALNLHVDEFDFGAQGYITWLTEYEDEA